MAFLANAFQIDLTFCYMMPLNLPAGAQALVNDHLAKLYVVEHSAFKAFEMAVEGNIGVVPDFVILNGY